MILGRFPFDQPVLRWIILVSVVSSRMTSLRLKSMINWLILLANAYVELFRIILIYWFHSECLVYCSLIIDPSPSKVRLLSSIRFKKVGVSIGRLNNSRNTCINIFLAWEGQTAVYSRVVSCNHSTPFDWSQSSISLRSQIWQERLSVCCSIPRLLIRLYLPVLTISSCAYTSYNFRRHVSSLRIDLSSSIGNRSSLPGVSTNRVSYILFTF